MPTQRITARDIDSGYALDVRIENGIFAAIVPSTTKTDVRAFIAPTLCDIQVNGYAGVDFQRDGVSADDLHRVASELLKSGCSQILLTLITDDWGALTARLRRLRKLRDASPELTRAFPGWHIEGPFLSAEPGFRGAHEPSVMIDPTPEKIHELRKLTGNDPLLLTMAPERAGALECIALATSRELGVRVSCGHTNASAETLAAAARAGATLFTHLGNGCPQQLDRHDNILWRVINTPGLAPGIIPDMIHVSPMLFRILHREMAQRLYLTTDCMSAAGAPPGRYSIGKFDVEVGADKVVRQPGKTNFAGSALTPIEGVMRSARMLDASWRTTWATFSTRPRELMGISGGIKIGAEATFCLLEPSGEQVRMRVFVAGVEKHAELVGVEV